MYLLDTNVCIHFMKNNIPSLTEKMLAQDPSLFLLSSITVFELEYGAAKSHWGERTRQNLALFLAPFTILAFDMNDAIEAGKIRGNLELSGKPIGPYDVLIAAQARSRGLTVITHNTREFLRVEGLKVEDWIV